MSRRLAFATLALLLVLPRVVWSHTVKMSDSQLTLQGSEATWNHRVHTEDFNVKFGNVDPNLLREYLPQRLGLSLGGKPCDFQDLQLSQDPSLQATLLNLRFRCPKSGAPLSVHYDLFYGDLSHRHLLKVEAFGKTYSATFAPGQGEAQFGKEGVGEAIRSFLKLGVEHILTGYDHILFILALIFGAKRFKDLLWLITSFALAHSVSLALSTLGIVTLPPSIVEPTIAASIVFLALLDLLATGPKTPRGMVLLTFTFGLIHGLGFSYVLKEAHLQAGNMAIPLVFFNLGVELGQLLVISLVYPLTLGLSRLFQRHYLRIKQGFLALIAGAGLYWMVERLFFG